MINSRTHHRFACHILVFLIYAGLTVYFLHPLSTSPRTYLPDRGDSFHNIWVLGSNTHTLFTNPFHLYQANIMYPVKDVGTFAETELINTVIFVPFMWAGNPVLGFNILLLMAFALTGFFSYLVLFQLSHNAYGSFIGALVIAFFPFRFAHLAHLQLLSFQWVLLAFYLLLRFLESKKGPDLLIFTVVFTAQAISPGYNTNFMLLLVGPYLLMWFLRSGSQERRLVFTRLAGSFAVIAIVCLPFYLPYIEQAAKGFHRTMNEFDQFSMDLVFYLGTPPANYAYGQWSTFIHGLRPDAKISTAFPGFTAMALLFLASLRVHFRSTERNRVPSLTVGIYKRETLLFLLLGIVFFLISLGPTVRLAGYELASNPIRFLFMTVPLFKSMRYVAAFAIPVVFCFSVLLAFALQVKLDNNRSRALKLLLVVTCGTLMIYEYRSRIPHTEVLTGSRIPSVYRWLAGQPGEFPIVEFPMEQEIRAGEPLFERQFEYMYYSVYHHKRLVNGVTGFFPPYHVRLLKQLNTFPSPSQARLLACLGVRYALLHLEFQSPDRIRHLDELESLGIAHRVGNFGNVEVYELNNWNGTRPRLLEATIDLQGEMAVPALRLRFDRSGACILPEEQELEVITDFTEPDSGDTWREQQTISLPGFFIQEPELIVPLRWNYSRKTEPFVVKTRAILRGHSMQMHEVKAQGVGKLPDSHDVDGLNAMLLDLKSPSQVKAGSTFTVWARVRNSGSSLWLYSTKEEAPPGKAEVRLGIKEWRRQPDDNLVTHPHTDLPLHARGFLTSNVAPGQETEISLSARAPTEPGQYNASLDLVSELVTWFGDLPGRQTRRVVPIEVTASEIAVAKGN